MRCVASTLLIVGWLGAQSAPDPRDVPENSQAITLRCEHAPSGDHHHLRCQLRNASDHEIAYQGYEGGQPVTWTQWQVDVKWEGPEDLECGTGVTVQVLASHELLEFDTLASAPRRATEAPFIRVGLHLDAQDGKGDRWIWSEAVRPTNR